MLWGKIDVEQLIGVRNYLLLRSLVLNSHSEKNNKRLLVMVLENEEVL